MATATSTRFLQCVVVTPERAVVDEEADFVALPLYDGEIGILPGRAPLVGRLGYGELRIKRGTQTKSFCSPSPLRGGGSHPPLAHPLPDADLAEVRTGTLGDRQRLVKGRRVHVLLDDGPAPVVDRTEHVPERGEVHCPLGRLAEHVL